MPQQDSNQHLIALFDGEGSVIIHDDVFRTWIAKNRKDTNLDEVSAKDFVEEFRVENKIPESDQKPIVFRRIRARRMLSMFYVEYEIYVHVVCVPKNFAVSVLTVSWDKHSLAEKLEPVLISAQQQLTRKRIEVTA
jgi:hypothetical protein